MTMRLSKKKLNEIFNGIFKNGIVVSIGLVPKLIEDQLGKKFIHTNQNCKCTVNRHKTLIEYLKCHNDIFHIRKFTEHFLFYKNNSRVDEFIKLTNVIRKFKFGKVEFNGVIESLICRLFPVKLTVLYDDLNKIFILVYKISLESLICGIDYLRIVSKHNIIYKPSNRGISLRIISFYLSNFIPDKQYLIAYEEIDKTLQGTLSDIGVQNAEQLSFRKILLHYDKIVEVCKSKNIDFDSVIELYNSNLPTSLLNDNLLSPSLMGILDEADSSLTSSRLLHLYSKNK